MRPQRHKKTDRHHTHILSHAKYMFAAVSICSYAAASADNARTTSHHKCTINPEFDIQMSTGDNTRNRPNSCTYYFASSTIGSLTTINMRRQTRSQRHLANWVTSPTHLRSNAAENLPLDKICYSRQSFKQEVMHRFTARHHGRTRRRRQSGQSLAGARHLSGQ